MCSKIAKYGYAQRLQSTDEHRAVREQPAGQAPRGIQPGSIRSPSCGANDAHMYRRLSFSPDDYLRTLRYRSWALVRGVCSSELGDGVGFRFYRRWRWETFSWVSTCRSRNGVGE